MMAKHDDLDVLLDATEMMNPKQLDGATDQTVEKREGHDGRGSSRVSLLVKSAFGLVHPTGWSEFSGTTRSDRPQRSVLQSPPSYLNDTLTLARYASTCPFSIWRSSSATSAMRTSRSEWAARVTAALAAFSQDSSLGTDEFDHLVHALGHVRLPPGWRCPKTTHSK